MRYSKVNPYYLWGGRAIPFVLAALVVVEYISRHGS